MPSFVYMLTTASERERERERQAVSFIGPNIHECMNKLICVSI